MTRHEAPSRLVPWLRPGLATLLSASAAAAYAGVTVPGARVVALLLFLLLCPGLGLVGLLDIEDPWREAALVVGVSLAVDLLVVTALAYYAAGTAGDALAVLIGTAVLGAAAQVARSAVRRSRRSSAR